MDFKYSDEAEAFRREFRTWLEANIPARRDKGDNEDVGSDIVRTDDHDWSFALNWHRKMNAGGWVGINWPKEYGGRGATLEQTVVYNEELVRARAPGIVNGLGIMLVGPTLIHWGTEEQKKRYVPKILSAEEIWCQGYSEPGAGSDVASLNTRAVEEGDDFIVNGQKVWTSGADRADWCILLVRTDPEAPKHKGISYLLVDMHSPGVTVRPLVQMTGEKGFNEVFFEDVRVPKKNLVGAKNQGWQVAVTTLMFERSSIAAMRDMMSSVKNLAQLAKKIARNGGTAWNDTAVRQKIAGFACDAAALRYGNMRQLTRRLKGLPPGPEGSVGKLSASDLNLKMAKFALELLGPYSQFEQGAAQAPDGGSWNYRMLAARAFTIAGGTSEIQHNIIGERVLGLPKG
ncbi:MAG TPA: acyl-CoA dehydrogenase family protein [Candidatus Binataceae bacterium]|jgi:alkylation response protein AidB-like acyl-CoA dehydrogenase|nr:acyl-CoA dehydrogenase family protein [Candidatus Binataceae bacterium]